MQSEKKSLQIHGKIGEIKNIDDDLITPVSKMTPCPEVKVDEQSDDSSSSLGDRKPRIKIVRKDSVQHTRYVQNNLF